jgi:hypothetical protein
MTWNAVCSIMTDLSVPGYLWGDIEVHFRSGEMDAVIEMLNAFANNVDESGCRPLDPARLKTAPFAPPEPWALTAATRVMRRLQLPSSKTLHLRLARCIEDEVDARDWERAREAAKRLGEPPDEFPDPPPAS